MRFELPPLPYAKDALEPWLGAETVTLHYEKHHRGYLRKLENLIGGSPLAQRSLEEVIVSSEGKVFNNAAQVWNHDFYWRSMAPRGGGDPGDPPRSLRADIEASFGTLDAFKTKLVDCAVAQFGSGYAWLYAEPSGALAIRSTHDAVNPLVDGVMPLLGIDLWEHAYYLDFHNERERYVRTFLDHLVDWRFAAEQRERVRRGERPVSDEDRAPAGSP